jgi:hypothetical protein
MSKFNLQEYNSNYFELKVGTYFRESFKKFFPKVSLKCNIELEELEKMGYNFINPGYIEDNYSEECLKDRFNMQIEQFFKLNNIKNEYKIRIRNQNFPEDVSENIIKFIVRTFDNDPTCYWNGKKDLHSYKGNVECKCFTTDGPISFSPSSGWDIIYFLDATKWSEKKFKLYKCCLKNTSKEWKNIKVNRTDTFIQHCQQGRRPHISWSSLQPQIESKIIFDGKFEKIFKKN